MAVLLDSLSKLHEEKLFHLLLEVSLELQKEKPFDLLFDFFNGNTLGATNAVE